MKDAYANKRFLNVNAMHVILEFSIIVAILITAVIILLHILQCSYILRIYVLFKSMVITHNVSEK